jgi:hypothetical protein
LKEKPTILNISEVEVQTEYALLISTCSGAWRYLIGDTIKFTNVDDAEIIITGRTKQFLSLCGEHLSQDNMNRAIDLVSEQLNISIPEFTVAGINYQNLFAHHWYVGTASDLDPELLRKMIDQYLGEVNDDYRVERIAALKEVFITVLPEEAFLDWMKKHGKFGGQHKFPRVMKNDRLEDWKEHIKQYPSKEIKA